MMNKLSKYTFIGTVTLLYMCFFLSCTNKPKQAAMPIMEIQVSRPLVQDLVLTKQYPGYLTAEQTVNLVARVPGVLQKVLFKAGSLVKKGTLLFVIEPTLYRDNLKKAKAALKTATAQLTYQRSHLNRMREAAKSNAVSEIQVIQTETNVSEAEADVNTAQAAISVAKTNLSYCYVRAPFDGTIDRSQFDVGNYVGAAGASTTLATLYKDEMMFAYFNVENKQYAKMMRSIQKATPISIQIGETGKVSYPGLLNYSSPNVDVATGTLSLRADIKNPKRMLKTGMYVTITLPYHDLKEAVLVREASIGTDQLGKFMYVVNDSNIVKYRPIVLGQLINDSLRQVQQGISPTERYVTTALLKVRDGMKIKPMH